MAAWDGTDASDAAFAGGLIEGVGRGRTNLLAIRAAYLDAQGANRPLLIPAGNYELALDPSYVTFFGIAPGEPVLELTVPIVGAGSSVTILKFVYPTASGGTALGGVTASIAFATGVSADTRIEGLQLEGPDAIGGEEIDGSDAPACWAVFVNDGTRLQILDVQTTKWNRAIEVDGSALGAEASLDRCHIKSRGTRIRYYPPAARLDKGGLTLINCTIEQDNAADGAYLSSTSLRHHGIHQGASSRLVIIGGQSLGCVEGNEAYDLHSSNDSVDLVPPNDTRPSPQIAISNHYFGRNGFVGIRLRPQGASVLIDNCAFAGISGIILGGTTTTTYHISNCAFVGGKSIKTLASDPNDGVPSWVTSYVGTAVSDSATDDIEAYLSNCKFGRAISPELDDQPGHAASGYENVVVRSRAGSSRPWSFTNCYFGGAIARCFFKAADGVNLFHRCHFVESSGRYPLEQCAGVIELHDCRKQGEQPFYFVTDQEKALEIVLEGCVLRQDSLLIAPRGLVFIRGSENEFGDYVSVEDDPPYDADRVTSDLQVKRGRGLARARRWIPGALYHAGVVCRNGDSPERVYECTSALSGASGIDGPSGTAVSIIDGKVTWTYLRDDADYDYDRGGNLLTLSWNADLVELDEYVRPSSTTSGCARAQAPQAQVDWLGPPFSYLP